MYERMHEIISHENLMGSGKWQTRIVQKILDAEVYTGDLVQGRTKTVDDRQVQADADNLIIVRGTHEAIVCREMFDAVAAYRKQVAEQYKKPAQKPYTPNIYKGKVFCGRCGGILNRQRTHDVYWFRCIAQNRISKDACVVVGIKERDLATYVMSKLRERLGSLSDRYSALGKNDALISDKSGETMAEIMALKQRAEKNRRFLRSLYENLTQGVLTSGEYFEMKAGYEAKISQDMERIAELEAGLSHLAHEVERYCGLQRDSEELHADSELNAGMVDNWIMPNDEYGTIAAYDATTRAYGLDRYTGGSA